MAWSLQNDGEDYRDYEADFSTMKTTGLARLTFVLDTHRAYALKANPAATPENDVETYLDESVDFSWEEAEAMIS